MVIQFILIAVIILIIARMFLQLKHGEISRRQVIGWLMIWIVAIVVIAKPEITSFLAFKTGVTRGVDLVVYVSILIIFYFLFRFLIRIEKMEADLTSLVRRVALLKDDTNKTDDPR